MPSSRIDVQLTSNARKDLKKLRHDMEGVTRALTVLESDPFAGHTLEGSLNGAQSLEFSLKGGGAYRAGYVVHEETICIVFIIGAHENIYKKAESRFTALKREIGNP